jgi:hypothetical protein
MNSWAVCQLERRVCWPHIVNNLKELARHSRTCWETDKITSLSQQEYLRVISVCMYIQLRMLDRVALNNRWRAREVTSVWWMTHFLTWKSRSAKFLFLFARRSKRRVVVRATVVTPLMDGICENLEEDWETGQSGLGRMLWQEANFVLGNINKITL